MPSVMALYGYSYGPENGPYPNPKFQVSAAFGRFPGSLGIMFYDIEQQGIQLSPPPFGNNATEFVSFSLYLDGFSIGAGPYETILQFFDITTSQVEVSINALRQIQLSRNGTILQTSINSLSNNAWYRLECQAQINSSSGFFEVKVDGVSWVSFSGNTRTSANNYCNQIGIGMSRASDDGSSAATIWIDDLVVYNTSGSAPTGYLGDKRIIMRAPNGPGDVTDFTPLFASWVASTPVVVGQQIEDSNGNVQRVFSIAGTGTTGSSPPTWATVGGVQTVDNAGANQVTWVVVGTGSNPGAANWMAVSEIPEDGDNSYNYSSTIGNIDRFASAGFPATATNIVLVYGIICSRKDDAGPRALRISVNSGGTIGDNGVDLIQLSTYQFFTGIFVDDPNTSSTWAIAGVNNLLWGYKVTA